MQTLVELIHALLDEDILDALDVSSSDSQTDHVLGMQIQTLRSLKRIEEHLTPLPR